MKSTWCTCSSQVTRSANEWKNMLMRSGSLLSLHLMTKTRQKVLKAFPSQFSHCQFFHFHFQFHHTSSRPTLLISSIFNFQFLASKPSKLASTFRRKFQRHRSWRLCKRRMSCHTVLEVHMGRRDEDINFLVNVIT